VFEATASATKPGHGLCEATWSVAHAGPGQASSPGSAQMGRRPQCPQGRVVFIGDARLGRYCPRVNATCPADDGSAPVFGKRPVCRFARAVTPTASSHVRPGVGRAPPGAVGRRIGASHRPARHSAIRRNDAHPNQRRMQLWTDVPDTPPMTWLIDVVQTSDDSS
jgi:hypothetical protein